MSSPNPSRANTVFKRRRARPVWLTELPIPAIKAQSLSDEVVSSLANLAGEDNDRLFALMQIACVYFDGRRMESQRATRPDCRRTLEVLSETAGRAGNLVTAMSQTARRILGRSLREALRSEEPTTFPGSLGIALDDLMDVNLCDFGSGLTDPDEIALRNFRFVAIELARHCCNLPMDAEWPLITIQEQSPLLALSLRDENLLYDLCNGLSRLASLAAGSLKRRRGPRSDTVRQRAVAALKCEFKRSGERTTHNPKDRCGYSGIASSPFDLFAGRFFGIVEPHDTQRRGLNDALRFACRQMTDRSPSDHQDTGPE